MEELAYKLLKDIYGYSEFRPNQLEIIKTVVTGNDCISLLPTGFGKSLTFILSSCILPALTIVISPLISLMNDQKKELDCLGIDAVVLHSNLTKIELNLAYKKILNNQVKIIYLAPERLLNKEFKNVIKDKDISLIAVDEAHTILWGESFRGAFFNISNFIDGLKKRPTILAVTATATTDTIDIIKKELKIKNCKIIKASMVRDNIIYNVINTNKKLDFLYQYLDKYKDDKVIIYCLTRKKVEEVFKKLINYKVCMYHGGMENSDKINNQISFTKGKKNVMVCTNAFGMGINISDIRHVIHYDIPSSLEDFAQQSGRAARDGKMASEVILFNFTDIKIIRSFINNLDKDKKLKEKKKVDQVVDFCLYKGCRHQYLGRYFGERVNKCNFLCDNCRKYA